MAMRGAAGRMGLTWLAIGCIRRGAGTAGLGGAMITITMYRITMGLKRFRPAP